MNNLNKIKKKLDDLQIRLKNIDNLKRTKAQSLHFTKQISEINEDFKF